MLANFRNFEVTDPFGRVWKVEFRWIQNAISIRHADTIDCKYYLTHGEERRELTIALSHPALVQLAERRRRELTDPWCMKLASLHLHQMISAWEDLDKVIVTSSLLDLERHNLELEKASAAAAEHAALYH